MDEMKKAFHRNRTLNQKIIKPYLMKIQVKGK